MTHTIEIKDYKFIPPDLAIKVGDSVQWKNLDAMRHSARRDNHPSFDTGPIRENKVSASIQFDVASPQEGYDYFCEPHPHMTGVIIVTA